MIIYENNKPHYFDKNGKEITDGCTIRYADGHTEKVYRTTDDQLGTDATNPSWIKSGRAVPCEYGLYPLGSLETDEVEVVKEGRGEGQFDVGEGRLMGDKGQLNGGEGRHNGGMEGERHEIS